MSNHEHEFYDSVHSEKYRDPGQTREEHARQMAKSMSSDVAHEAVLSDIFLNTRFLPAGRVQAAMGASQREVSAFNCSVSMKIEDNIESIMQAAYNSAKILRLGTGIGYNFSNIRPKGALIVKLQTEASGPLSFMNIFEAVASTIASSGHRRGAQMGILNCDHPDIEEFVDSKLVAGRFRHFNISVGISDAFMEALDKDADWPLQHNGKVYKVIKASYLWNKIMRNAYASAEPGVLFLDRMNTDNNLRYCETIEATNPCSEQPLPPNGLCLLGSFDLTKYVHKIGGEYILGIQEFIQDIAPIVEAYDNIFDRSVYALPEHEKEAKSKRRIGLGLTGVANAIELCSGGLYGSAKFNNMFEHVAKQLMIHSYSASIKLAQQRGAFEAFTPEYLNSPFIRRLGNSDRVNSEGKGLRVPVDRSPTRSECGVVNALQVSGTRNSHLISYAPCGTISLINGNVSSGIEPVFHDSVIRDVHMRSGVQTLNLRDWAFRNYGFSGRSLEDCTISDHLSVTSIAQRYCDSSVSKTVNVATSCSYQEYQNIYRQAYDSGSKGLTVFRPGGVLGQVISPAHTPVKDTVSQTPPTMLHPGQSGSCVNGACSL